MNNDGDPSILIVDDNPANLDLLVSALDGLPYNVRVSAQPELGLRSALAHPPDLILLDVRMPKMDGFEFLEKLRENPHTANVPVIFLSASTDTTEIQRAMSLGASNYLTKPINLGKMIQMVEGILR